MRCMAGRPLYGPSYRGRCLKPLDLLISMKKLSKLVDYLFVNASKLVNASYQQFAVPAEGEALLHTN